MCVYSTGKEKHVSTPDVSYKTNRGKFLFFSFFGPLLNTASVTYATSLHSRFNSSVNVLMFFTLGIQSVTICFLRKTLDVLQYLFVS